MRALEKEMLRVSEQLEKGFIARNFTLKIVMVFIIYPIAALISAFTEGTHLYTNFQDTFHSGFLPMALTVLIVLFIELGQYFAINKVVDDLREGVFAESMNHVAAFVIAAIIGVVLMGISVTLSVQGAPITNEYFKKQKTPLELVNLDEINARYDNQISGEQKTLDMANKMTWKGKIVEDGRRLAKKAADQKATIEKNRQAEIAAATSENNRRTEEYNSKLEHSGAWFTGFAGLGEVIKLICLIFIGNYEAGARKEVGAGSSPTQGAAAPISQSFMGSGGYSTPRMQYGAQAVPPNTGAQARTIIKGFMGRNPVDQDNLLQQVATGEEDTSDVKATDDYKEGIRDVLKNGVAPTPDNKATIEMALKNAKSNLAAWKSKLGSGKGKPETNKRKIAYWSGVCDQLNVDLQKSAV